MSAAQNKRAPILEYFRDPEAIQAVEVDDGVRRLFESDPDGGLSLVPGCHSTGGFDHLVLARSKSSGLCVGLLGAEDRTTSAEEDVLLITGALLTEQFRCRGLVQRMVSMLMLREFGNNALPRVLAVRTSNSSLYQPLARLAGQLPGALLYPSTDGKTVNLSTAALARRIARQIAPAAYFEIGTGKLHGGPGLGLWSQSSRYTSVVPRESMPSEIALCVTDQILAVLDLRAAAEREIVEEARKIFRRQ